MKTRLPDRSDVLPETPHVADGWFAPHGRTLAHIRCASNPRSLIEE